MAIVQITETTEITAGKFVCARSHGAGLICTYPRQVTRVVGKRIYFVREDDDRQEYMSRDRASYLCDTAEEGKTLCHLGIERSKAMDQAEAEARRKVVADFAPQVAVLLGREANA